MDQAKKFMPAREGLKLLAALVLLGGCHAPPLKPPMPAPVAIFQMNHFWGTPLSGPTQAGVLPVNDPASALAVNVTFVALERVPKIQFDLLGSRARLISATQRGQPVMPSAQLTRTVQMFNPANRAEAISRLVDANAGQTAPMVIQTGALPEHICADFSALDLSARTDLVTGDIIRRSVGLEIARGTGNSLQMALLLNDIPHADPQASLQSEIALFDLNSKQQQRCTVFVIPFQFTDSASRAVAVIAEIQPGSNDPQHVADVARCIADVRRSSHAVTAGSADISAGISGESGIQTALAGLANPADRRSALVFVAANTGANLCEQVALVADDADLDNLSRLIRIETGKTDQTVASVGWILDKTTLQFLDRQLNAAEGAGPPMARDLAAILLTFAGEPGRHPSSMDPILRGVASPQDLHNRLLVENMVFLEDSSPASRVRAFAWLQSAGHAPAGFDPLAPSKQRRLALEQSQAATAPTTISSQSGSLP